MHLYLVPDILDTPEPGDILYLVPGVPYAFLLVARCLRHPKTWFQVSHVHFYLVPDVLEPQNLVPGVPDTPEPHARCPLYTFTWCQVS